MKDDEDFIDEDIDVFDRPGDDQDKNADERWASLPLSMLLSVEDADELLRWRSASIVAIVGERNGGKTTLITEIYERFLRGPFADTWFCDSWSLLGFERKSFQSRAESGTERPDTPRTSAQDGLKFFHLAVSMEADLCRRDLLISERAGEVYRDVRDKPELAADLLEVSKANIIVFIVDGERVADPRKRAEVFASVRSMIRALSEPRNVATSTQIQLVTTKCDLIEGDATENVQEALTEFENRISEMFGEKYLVNSFRTVARDPRGVVEPARGLAPLLRSWLETPPLHVYADARIPELSDEFDRLLLRRTVH